MGVVAFAGDEFRLAVVVDIVPSQSVALRELLIDQVLPPGRCAIGLRLQLLVPVQPVTVTVRPDDVVSAVFVEVNNQNRATGMRQIEIMVILPAAGERI